MTMETSHLEKIVKDLDPTVAGLLLPMLKEVILDNCDKKGLYKGPIEYLIYYKRISEYVHSTVVTQAEREG